MKLILTTAAIALIGTAGYIGLSKQETYHIVHQEELHLLEENAFIRGWEQREREYFNEVAEIAAQIHGASDD